MLICGTCAKQIPPWYLQMTPKQPMRAFCCSVLGTWAVALLCWSFVKEEELDTLRIAHAGFPQTTPASEFCPLG